ncbi:MAG: hypothetical protein DME18_15860 [Verrucomicrobia bacterium]|nr:MAG: hypothetical protein DME18_15860 [Verrucomicrobiota bacterium]
MRRAWFSVAQHLYSYSVAFGHARVDTHIRYSPHFWRGRTLDKLGDGSLTMPSVVSKELRILVLEDEADDLVLINRELRKSGLDFRCKRVDTREDFVRELQHSRPDLILSDHGLPAFHGFAALAIARNQCPDVPFIFVTGSQGEEMAAETFRSGATDYVLKGRLSSLVPAVQRALHLVEERARRQEAEQALRESEERFRALVEGVKDYAIIMLDLQGHITSWNTGAEFVHGYGAGEIIGRHFSCFYSADEIIDGKPEKSLELAKAYGRLEEEGWRVRKDGAQFWANAVISTSYDHRGELRGFALVTRDVTERKQAQEALQKSEERYRRLVKLRAEAFFARSGNGGGFADSAAVRLLDAVRRCLNLKFKRIGRMTAVSVDSKNKTISLRLDLKGEPAPVEVNIRGYMLQVENGAAFLELGFVRTTREWIDTLLEHHFKQRRLEVTGWEYLVKALL